jgi:hypothetical protein
MTGRITRLIDEQQAGRIAGEDGIEYAFQGGALIGTTFGALHLESKSPSRRPPRPRKPGPSA